MTDICYSIEDAGRAVIVSLDRPPVNALTQQDYRQLAELFEGFGELDGADAVLVRSAQDRAFCAGADLTESPGASRAVNSLRQASSRRLFRAIRHCRVPVVAVIDAPAVGAGLVIAACADIRIAGPRATFALTEIDVGKGGGGRHAMSVLPPGIARLLYFTGRPLLAERAYATGLVDILVDGDRTQVDDAARDLIAQISAKNPIALRLGKEALLLAEKLPIEEGYQVEQQYSMRLAETSDAQEAALAFLEKRAPNWRRE